MAMHLPVALTLNALDGGYASHLDMATLSDNQTNDAKNTIITPTHIEQRGGYSRILNSALTKTGVREATLLDGEPIKGHFHLKKSTDGGELKKHCVFAGGNMWDYNSSTAAILLGGLSTAKDAIWSFAQIQDPRDAASGTDDIMVGANGYDMPVIWNGEEDSASYLDDVPGSSGVMPAKFCVSVKNQIILMNINDQSDVDSKSKFMLSSFSDTGVPQPHVYPADLQFYAGGSDKYGGITGGCALRGKIVIFKRNTFYYFNMGGATSVNEEVMGIVYDFSLQQVNENIGCIAPKTIVSLGDMVLFLSALGVYAYDGENLVYLSKPIERDLKDVNHLYMEYACAGYDRGKNQYWLAVPSKGKNYNDTVFVYDFFLKAWMPPYTDMNCDIISGFEEGGQEKILCGSSDGYLYRLNHGKNNGMEVGYNIVPSSLVGSDVVAFYDSQSIYTEGDGLLGLPVRALDVSGGDGLTRIITAATATQITVSPPWGSSVNSNTTMCLLGIDSYIRTKDYALGSPDQLKLFRQFSPRLLQSGKFDVKVNAIIDINDLSQAMSADVSVYDPSIICFTGGDYATGTSSRFSGTIETVSVGASSVIVSAGSDISASLLAGYCMYYWNSGTRRVWPINSGECEALNLGLYGTQSLVAVNSDTTYLINTNLEGTFGTARWGMGKTSKKDIAVRGTSLQDCVGEYISFKIGNNRANETWRMYGFDILSKPIGRR